MVGKVSRKKDETLKIVFSKGFSSVETEEIAEAFSKIMPVEKRYYVTETVETVAVVLIIFILGMISQGFFKAIGSDLYRTAKEKVIKKLKNSKNPTLIFEMSYKGTKISITSRTNDERQLNNIFDTIDKSGEIAMRELDKRETPEMNEMTIHYDEGWIVVSGRNWKPPEVIKFYKYNKKNGRWELTDDWSNR